MLEKWIKLYINNHNSCWLIFCCSIRGQKLEVAEDIIQSSSVFTLRYGEEHHDSHGEQKNPTAGGESRPHLQTAAQTCQSLMNSEPERWDLKYCSFTQKRGTNNVSGMEKSCGSDDGMEDTDSYTPRRCWYHIHICTGLLCSNLLLVMQSVFCFTITWHSYESRGTSSVPHPSASFNIWKCTKSHKLLFCFGLHHFVCF